MPARSPLSPAPSTLTGPSPPPPSLTSPLRPFDKVMHSPLETAPDREVRRSRSPASPYLAATGASPSGPMRAQRSRSVPAPPRSEAGVDLTAVPRGLVWPDRLSPSVRLPFRLAH